MKESPMKAGVIVIVIVIAGAAAAGAYLSDSGGAQYCGCGLANDQHNFPVYAHALLNDLVLNGPYAHKDPDSGYTNYIITNPAFGGSGAAYGSAICTRGLPTTECATCLSDAREYLRQCETYACGGGSYPNKCSVEFWQLE